MTTECRVTIDEMTITWDTHEWTLEARAYRDCTSPDCGCPRLPYVCDQLRCANCGAAGVRRFPIIATLTEIITGAIETTSHLPA